MTKAKDLADKIDLHLQVNSPGFHLSDDDMRLIAASLRGGELPQSSKQCGESCELFDMLWRWFEDESRIGAQGMRPERHEGLSADDFKTMLDEHEAALLDSRPDRERGT